MESQEERLREEILADAKRRADKILARARSDGESAAARARRANERRRKSALAEAQASGEQKRRNILQGVETEKRRMWLQRREECIDEVLAAVRARAEGLEAGSPERAAALAALAEEAFASVGAAAQLRVAVNPADAALATPTWLRERGAGAAECAVEADPRIGGGIRVATPDGRLFYDNTFAARLKRLRERFRTELAETVPDAVLNPPLGTDAESRGDSES